MSGKTVLSDSTSPRINGRHLAATSGGLLKKRLSRNASSTGVRQALAAAEIFDSSLIISRTTSSISSVWLSFFRNRLLTIR